MSRTARLGAMVLSVLLATAASAQSGPVMRPHAMTASGVVHREMPAPRVTERFGCGSRVAPVLFGATGGALAGWTLYALGTGFLGGQRPSSGRRAVFIGGGAVIGAVILSSRPRNCPPTDTDPALLSIGTSLAGAPRFR